MSRARSKRMRIGIGVGKEREKVRRSRDQAVSSGLAEVIVYDDPLALAEDLINRRIDAAVRGDLGSNDAMAAVRSVFGVGKVLRAAFMEPPGGRMFLLAPVGIDEGWTVQEKLEMARLGDRMLRQLGITPRIGIMSGGRSSDKGRSDAVDRTIDDAVEVVRLARAEGMDAQDVQILIEDAVRECDMVIAPDGISGNLIFRTLHFLGNGKALGAPILNIDRVYIDTSRAKADYVDSIALASALSSGR